MDNNKVLNDVEVSRNKLVQDLATMEVGSAEYERTKARIAELDEALERVYKAMMSGEVVEEVTDQ